MSRRAGVPEKHRYLDSVACQNLFYGTAWKKEDTAELVYSAIKAGFRSIATAAQPKHYRENLVGEGVRRAIQENIVSRKDLFVSPSLSPYLGWHHALSNLENAGGVLFLLILYGEVNFVLNL